MRRREVLALVGCGALGWPLNAYAQQPAMPVIGFLNSRTLADTTHLLAGLRKGLAENGYVEGRDVTIEYRWALGQYARLPALAQELVRRNIRRRQSGQLLFQLFHLSADFSCTLHIIQHIRCRTLCIQIE